VTFSVLHVRAEAQAHVTTAKGHAKEEFGVWSATISRLSKARQAAISGSFVTRRYRPLAPGRAREEQEEAVDGARVVGQLGAIEVPLGVGQTSTEIPASASIRGLIAA
jgi:hypothetical protein